MALRDQPYLPLYIQDFMTDEKLIECSASATGVYIRLMCIMHKSKEYGTILLKQKYKQTDKQTENFALQLDRQMPYTVDEIKSGINELISEEVIILSGEKITQPRMVKDNDISLKRSEAGKKGGEKSQFAKAKPEAKPQANSEDESEYDNVSEINIDFEIFWNLYNRKKGDKKKCKKKWESLNNETRQLIIDILPQYVQQFREKQYQPYPYSFLNGEFWNNDIEFNQTPLDKHRESYLKSMEDLI